MLGLQSNFVGIEQLTSGRMKYIHICIDVLYDALYTLTVLQAFCNACMVISEKGSDGQEVSRHACVVGKVKVAHRSLVEPAFR